MGIFTDNKFCFIDFEFNRSAEPVLNLVSCSFQTGKKVNNIWLHNHQSNQKKLKKHFISLRKKGYIFVAYAAAAEARSFMALGLDPSKHKWVDLYMEHRQLTHTYNKFKYGTYFHKTAIPRKSVPPSYVKSHNKGKDNNAVGMGYKDAVAVHFGAYIDSKHKTAMRDLILEDKDSYPKNERTEIMDYCASDIKWLPKLLESMNTELTRVLKLTATKVLKAQTIRGDYASSLAKMESEGFPLWLSAVKNLSRNFNTVKDTLISELNKVYPFYIQEKVKVKGFQRKYVQKYTLFAKFLEECPDIDHKAWPLTDTGNYKTDEETLEKYDGVTEIYALRQCNKLLGQLKWFQEPEEGKKNFFDNVGSDDNLRAFLGAFGTQTGRNAPKAKTYILAMSAWLRCLIRPKKGEAIVGIDYASQEFIIAAVMAKDPAMMEAYAYGDPYLYFAIKANAVSHKDGDWWKAEKAKFELDHHYECPDIERYKHVAGLRSLFKATTLGLQYGMGALNLSLKLTADCGRFVSESEARNLIALHKKTYPKYWRWLDKKIYEYKRNKFLLLKDGWALLPNNDNDLSVKNFPVQGTGAVIMRRAVYLAHKRGLRIIAPLHDALYAIYNEKTQSDHPDILSECMQQAVEDVLGKGVVIRQDRDIHTHKDVWIDEKGEKYYDMLKGYLEPMETEQDIDNRLNQDLFNENVDLGYAMTRRLDNEEMFV